MTSVLMAVASCTQYAIELEVCRGAGQFQGTVYCVCVCMYGVCVCMYVS
jgi:hypothetical protein